MQNAAVPTTGTIRPHSLDAEKVVLGALILDSERAVELVPLLDLEDFYDPTYRRIFEGIAACVEKRKAVDFLLLSDELKGDEKILELGGVVFLAALAESVPTSSHAKHYIDILKKNRLKRESISFGEHVSAMGYGDATSEAVPDALMEGSRRMAKFLQKEDEGREELIRELTEQKTIIPTGYPQMDALLGGGLGPGDLFLIAARPSVGKSALATCLAANFMRNGICPAFFSLEMSKKQVATRLLCSYYNKTQEEAYKEARQLICDLPVDIHLLIGINDLQSITAAILSSDASVFIIDYLGLITSEKHSREGRFQVLDEISRSIKNLAVQCNKPIIMLTQLNREIEKDKANREPYLSDLWGGGEKDADIITMLWDPDARLSDTEKKAKELEGSTIGTRLKWLVRKHRNGPTGDIMLKFTKEKFLLEEDLSQVAPEKKLLPAARQDAADLPF